MINISLLESERKRFIVAKAPTMVIETNQGNIEVTLMPSVAPKACENFQRHSKGNYYKGTIFHRIIKEFMIQTGDPTGTGSGGKSIWGEAFEDEVLEDVAFTRPGILAMANAGPKTNGSQFFITTVATPWLNMRHTIFGEVTAGMDIVTKIENVKTDAGDRPIEPVKILRIYEKEA